MNEHDDPELAERLARIKAKIDTHLSPDGETPTANAAKYEIYAAVHEGLSGIAVPLTPSADDGEQGRIKVGVSLFDAAMILTDEDKPLAQEMVAKWHRLRAPLKPDPIGKCPNHGQRRLYAPKALSDWVEKVEGRDVCSESQLRQGLLKRARKPRND